MTIAFDDTIAALASPAGSAVRGIIRASGIDVGQVVSQIFTSTNNDDWQQIRSAVRREGTVQLEGCQALLPTSVYYWPTTRSYTGQPMAEFHTLGSPPLLERLLETLYAGGVRPARPGEFTLRAFLAGRVDLVQAEAVLGVIDAHDHVELELALEQLAGGLSGKIGNVRQDLLELLAELEAGLDFVEDDIAFIEHEELLARLRNAEDILGGLYKDAHARMTTTTRRNVVLAGLPNAGKSTLFNALAGRPAALVSELAGTTRDYLVAQLDWDGMGINLFDTAGWEAALAGIGGDAQTLSAERRDRSDLILWCTGADIDASQAKANLLCLNQCREGDVPVITMTTKTDLADADAISADIAICAQTGSGLAELMTLVTQALTAHTNKPGALLGGTASRCRESLASSLAAITRALETAEQPACEDLVAVEIRDALEHLGKIVGAVYTDDLLDRIFSKFCIGK